MKKDTSWLVAETRNFADLNSNWEYPEEFPELSKADLVAIDTETRDPGLIEFGPGWPYRDGNLVGVSVAAVYGDEIFKGYYPIAHALHGEHENMDKNKVISWLKTELKGGNNKVFANAAYDLGWLKTEGVIVNGLIEDVQIMAPLLDEHRFSYSLDSLGKSYLNETKDEVLLNKAIEHYKLKNPKGEMYKLSPKFVGPYAEQDALLTLKLYHHFNKLIDCDPVSGLSLRKVYELETKLIPILFKIQERGMRVDIGKAEQVQKEFELQIKEKQKWLNNLAGFEVNINSGDDLGRACDNLGITYSKTEKTNKPSFKAAFIENHESEFLRQIRETRQMLKAKSTFIEGAVLNKVHNGRIYPQFNQLKRDEDGEKGVKGTISGRFSCTKPNIQQISARDEIIAPLIRQCFLPEEDTLWGSFDYSQQEPRWTIHTACKVYRANASTYWIDHLATAEKARQKLLDDPATDYHQLVADLASISRKEAKTINLGVAYGMGGLKLCKNLGLSTEWKKRWGKMQECAGPEGEEILKKYHEGAAYIKGLSKYCDNIAQESGYVLTVLGRHARFDKWVSKDFDLSKGMAPVTKEQMHALMIDPTSKYYGHGMARYLTYAAMNRVIQGSSADQTKLAMLLTVEAGYLPYGSIHDELPVPINIGNKDKEVAEIKEIMENCIPMLVPSLVNVGIGKTWGGAKV